MGYLERNSETLKTPGFSGFDSRVSGFSRVVIFGFGSGSGSKKVGLFPRVLGFRVQRPITSHNKCHKNQVKMNISLTLFGKTILFKLYYNLPKILIFMLT